MALRRFTLQGTRCHHATTELSPRPGLTLGPRPTPTPRPRFSPPPHPPFPLLSLRICSADRISAESHRIRLFCDRLASPSITVPRVIGAVATLRVSSLVGLASHPAAWMRHLVLIRASADRHVAFVNHVAMSLCFLTTVFPSGSELAQRHTHWVRPGGQALRNPRSRNAVVGCLSAQPLLNPGVTVKNAGSHDSI